MMEIEYEGKELKSIVINQIGENNNVCFACAINPILQQRTEQHSYVLNAPNGNEKSLIKLNENEKACFGIILFNKFRYNTFFN